MNASTRPSRPSLKIRLALLAAALSLAACRELPRVPPGVLFDPQMGPAEETYFRQSFEKRPASIRLGPG
ncbi:MAG: hypothetical protein QOJ16_1114, partial [Acidobacteriota bacterium]|nr:hypothetical protein [Acidobacteriota bacterium]